MLRLGAVEFLIRSAQLLGVSPIVKYSALSLFVERFYPALPRFEGDKGTKNWLLHPVRESNLQLFSLVSIWLSSKIHDTTPLSVEVLKSFGDEFIKDQHYTKRDLLDAEMALMQVLKFEIGTSHVAFIMVDELFSQLKVIARVGEHVNDEVCMDVLDLLYEKEATSVLYNSPCFLAASILACLHISSAGVSLTFCFLSRVNGLWSILPFSGCRICYLSTCTEVGIPHSSLGQICYHIQRRGNSVLCQRHPKAYL